MRKKIYNIKMSVSMRWHAKLTGGQ